MIPKKSLLTRMGSNEYAAPWSFDQEYGQIRDKDGNSLASVPVSLGDGQDLRNGELMARAPSMLQTLERVIKLLKSPDKVSDEEIAEIRLSLKEIGLE